MRKVLLLAFAMCILSANAAFAELKIGVVDMQVIGSESVPAKVAKQKMEEKYGPQRKKLEADYKVLQKKVEDLQKKPTEKKQVEYVKLKRKFDEQQYSIAREVEKDQVKIRQEMVRLAFKAAYDIAQEKGLNFIVDWSTGGVLYAEKSMDLTSEVLRQVNKLWEDGEKSAPAKEAPKENTKKKQYILKKINNKPSVYSHKNQQEAYVF